MLPTGALPSSAWQDELRFAGYQTGDAAVGKIGFFVLDDGQAGEHRGQFVRRERELGRAEYGCPGVPSVPE